MAAKNKNLFDPAIVRAAVRDSFWKLDPRLQVKNPVMFVVLVGAILCSGLLVRDIAHRTDVLVNLQIALWLWFTVLFANFAEAMAEGRGKAQAEALRRGKKEMTARRLTKKGEEAVNGTDLRKGDRVVVEANEVIPGDGTVVEGVASVDESAITGESAPVIREAGGDRSAVTGGTRVLSDRIVVEITSNPGETFLDRMIALVEGAVQEVVSRVTRIEVRERVPDRLLGQADAIVNVDLPSEELIERLKAGKIYPAERVPAALANFFREENLASLRELALRSLADRLDASRKSQEPVGAKVMVSMSANPETTRLLLRKGSGIAGRLNTNWFAVYVRTPEETAERLSAKEHRLLIENVTLAMELGAKVVWLAGKNPSAALLKFARENGITLALFGKSQRPFWQRLLRRHPKELMSKRGTGIDVFEVETQEGE